MDEDGAFTFKKPTVDYQVVFDVGQGHVVTIDGGDITKEPGDGALSRVRISRNR